jgi:hypothetical protein
MTAIIRFSPETNLWQIIIDGKARKQEYLKRSDCVIYCRQHGILYEFEET